MKALLFLRDYSHFLGDKADKAPLAWIIPVMTREVKHQKGQIFPKNVPEVSSSKLSCHSSSNWKKNSTLKSTLGSWATSFVLGKDFPKYWLTKILNCAPVLYNMNKTTLNLSLWGCCAAGMSQSLWAGAEAAGSCFGEAPPLRVLLLKMGILLIRAEN